MKTKTTILTLLMAMAVPGLAQDSNPPAVSLQGFPTCAFQQLFTKANVSYLDLIKTYKNTNAHGSAAKTTADAVYDIPVVFHIVCHTPAWDLDDSIIANQVDILSKAYRRQHADTASVRSFFSPLSGDSHIQFHLATVDPDGNPTNGITRTHTTFKHFGDSLQTVDSLERVKHTATGGMDAWPTDKYLNIWVCNMSDSHGHLGVLGYGIPPINPLPPNWPAGVGVIFSSLQDGVVIQVHAVGSNNPLNASLGGLITKGRGLVHEVGHYLGLQHVFGDNDGSPSGMCGMIADDGINDTPEQSTSSFDASSNFACPPAGKNTCGNGTANDLPDMWENYMDYAHDACQVMFTQEQIAIMRSVLGNQRSLLPAALATGINAIAADQPLKIYPNPAADKLNVQYAEEISHIAIRNVLGEVMMEAKGMAARAGSYDVSNFPAGQYIVLVETKSKIAVSKFIVVK